MASPSVIGSISSTAPRPPGGAERQSSHLPDDRLALAGRQQLGQVVRQRRQPRGDLPLALLRLEQLVRDVERGQDRGLVRFHDRALRQHLLQRLVHVRRHLTREVAAYVDQALKKVLSQGPIVETHKAAILAALDITNELFQAKKGEREVSARLAALADDLTKLLPPGKRKV